MGGWARDGTLPGCLVLWVDVHETVRCLDVWSCGWMGTRRYAASMSGPVGGWARDGTLPRCLVLWVDGHETVRCLDVWSCGWMGTRRYAASMSILARREPLPRRATRVATLSTVMYAMEQSIASIPSLTDWS